MFRRRLAHVNDADLVLRLIREQIPVGDAAHEANVQALMAIADPAKSTSELAACFASQIVDLYADLAFLAEELDERQARLHEQLHCESGLADLEFDEETP